MNRERIIGWVRRFQPVLIAAGLAIAIGVAFFLLPQRGAAAVGGVVAGGLLCFYLIGAASRSTAMAFLWMSIAVAADAAYAKLNDQQPMTLANALMRIVDALIKLTEPLLREFGSATADPRAKAVSAVPDFVWSAILAFIVFMIVRLSVGESKRR